MLFVKKRWATRKTEALSDEPAEDGQKTKIDQQLANMTKGEAANIIIRLKHGAKVCGTSSKFVMSSHLRDAR